MSHDKNMAANNEDKQPRKKSGVSIYSREFKEYLSRNAREVNVNNYKKGGGYSSYK